MFCQNCGKENSDGATFCNSCGANLTKKSTPTTGYCSPWSSPECRVNLTKKSTQTAADIQLKENEIRLLQEKFNSEASHIGPSVYAIAGFIVIVIGYEIFSITGGGPVFIVVGLGLIYKAWVWDNSKSAAATETEIKLKAAKAELKEM
jgi:hypothetical protein